MKNLFQHVGEVFNPNQPKQTYNLGQIVSFLHKQDDKTYFNIPNDSMGIRSIIADRKETREKLARINSITKTATIFTVMGEELVKIIVDGEEVLRRIVRITAEHIPAKEETQS